jgi:hypothetical protein
LPRCEHRGHARNDGPSRAGVVDWLRQLGVPVWEVQFGGKADAEMAIGEETGPYANKRAQIWGRLREWLRGGAIPDDPELKADLTGVEFGYNAANAIQLERKEDMKKRGLASPDIATRWRSPSRSRCRVARDPAFMALRLAPWVPRRRRRRRM